MVEGVDLLFVTNVFYKLALLLIWTKGKQMVEKPAYMTHVTHEVLRTAHKNPSDLEYTSFLEIQQRAIIFHACYASQAHSRPQFHFALRPLPVRRPLKIQNSTIAPSTQSEQNTDCNEQSLKNDGLSESTGHRIQCHPLLTLHIAPNQEVIIQFFILLLHESPLI